MWGGYDCTLGGGGGAIARASALGDRQKGLCGSSLIRVTSMHEIKSNRPYV